MNQPAVNQPAVNHSAPREIRARTVVFGLIALAIASSVLIEEWLGFVVPGQFLVLGVLIGSGALLVLSGLLTAFREQREQAISNDPARPDSHPTSG